MWLLWEKYPVPDPNPGGGAQQKETLFQKTKNKTKTNKQKPSGTLEVPQTVKSSVRLCFYVSEILHLKDEMVVR